MKPAALLVVLALSAGVGLVVRKMAPIGAQTAQEVAPVAAPEPVSHAKPEKERGKKGDGPINPVFPDDLEVRGIAAWGGRISIQLSDGSRVTDRDKELVKFERNSVTLCLAHPAGLRATCPACRKYPLKPGMILPQEKRLAEKKEVNLTPGVQVGPVAPKTYSGAANPPPVGYSERPVPLAP